MAVRIRLQRKGAKHMAFFRIVVADSRSPRDGRFVEQLGYYDPLRDPPDIKVDTEKVIGWLSKGAKPTETVDSLLRQVGIMQTWHEMKRGKSLDELRHIEDEARKRLDAKASMERRKRESDKKEEKAVSADESAKAAVETAPAGDEVTSGSEAEATAGETADDAKTDVAAPEEPEPAPVTQEEKPE